MAVKEFFRNLHQRKVVRAITTATILIGLPFVGAYSYFWEVHDLKLDKIKLKLSHRFPHLKGLKAVQLSDLHYGPSNSNTDFFNRAVDMINAQNPDIVLLTGDYYQWDPQYLEVLPKILSRIRSKQGIFGVFGNHDYGSCYPGVLHCDPFEHTTIKKTFAENDIVLLGNESTTLNYKGQDFNLVGLHDLWSGFFNPDEAFAHVDKDLPTLLLSHNPDTVHMVEHDFDLMMAGHVHGGQVSWPLIGPLAVPVKNRNLRRGLHKISERKHIYVNRGLGFTFRMRLNSRPEVTVLEIV